VVSDVAARTPIIAQINPELRRQLKDPDLDPSRKAKLYGQMATGMTAISGAAILAQNGNITGTGPKDYQVRKRWIDAGWQPYSVRMQNDDGTWTYRSYNRADPLGMFFALVANWHEISQNITVEENEEVAAIILAGTEALSSKTFLQGAYTLMDIVRSGRRSAIASHISAYAPNLLRDAARLQERVTGEPVGGSMEESRFTDHPANRWLGKMYAKIPWMNDDLPRQINIITGNVVEKPESSNNWYGSVNLATLSHENGDPVLDEMKKLRMSYEPPEHTIGETELDRYQYEELQRLTHQPDKNTPTLHEALLDLISSDEYQGLNPHVEDYGKAMGVNAPSRQSYIRSIISKAKEFGRAEFLSRHPDILQRLEATKMAVYELHEPGREGAAPPDDILNNVRQLMESLSNN